MADNVTANAGSGGATFATDDDGTAHHPYFKIEFGANNTQTKVSSSDPLPVVQTGTHTVTGTGGTFPVTDSGGSLTVDNNGTFAVQAVCTNAGTFAVQVDGNALTALQLIDDCIYADDGAWTGDTSKHALIGGIYQSSPQTVTDGRTAPILLDANGKVQVATHAVTQSGTWNVTNVSGTISLPTGASTLAEQQSQTTHLSNIATSLAILDDWDSSDACKIVGTGTAGTANSGVVTVQGIASMTPVQVSQATASNLNATVVGTGTFAVQATCTNAGTFAVQDATAQASLSVMDDWDNAASDGASVSGDVAHGSADAGEPVKLGAKAETSLKGITLVSDGPRTNAYADADGVQIVKLCTTGADAISEAVSNTDGASTAFTNFSAVASTFNYITAYSIFRTDSGTSMAYVDFRDGTAGAVLWRVPLPPTGGANLSLGGLPIFKTSAATALAYDVSSALTTVYISVSGYQSKV